MRDKRTTERSSTRQRRDAALHVLIVGVVPTALVVIGSVTFILNFFYSRPPYVLDAGWYSVLIHRAGVVPINPPAACAYANTFYGVHLSPILSVFSALSYLVPLGRIEWFAVFQAAVYAPLGLSVYLVASHANLCARPWRAALTALAGIAFAFSGQVLFCIIYPHYEPAIAGCATIVLASIATGRRRLAIVFFALTLTLREDAGGHLAFALLPLVLLHARLGAGTFSRRQLVTLTAGAFAASVAMMAIQKVVFHSVDLLRTTYLGTPTLGHVDAHFLAERLRFFLCDRPFIVVPLTATVILAMLRRDPGYLLGWVVTLPWFVINLVALDLAKHQFEAYVGFPFLVSLFWVYLYASALAPPDRRIRSHLLDVAFASIGIASVVATYFSSSRHVVVLVLDGMTANEPGDRSSVRRFGDGLRRRTSELGTLIVDDAVAAHALESIRYENLYRPHIAAADSLAFHAANARAQEILLDVSALGLNRCLHLIGTEYSVCRRDALPSDDIFGGAPSEVLPPLLTITGLRTGDGIGPAGGRVDEKDAPKPIYDGHLGGLDGDIELVWRIEVERAEPGATRLADLVLVRSDRELARVPFPASPGTHERIIPFTAKRGVWQYIHFDQLQRATFRITAAEVRRASSAPPPTP